MSATCTTCHLLPRCLYAYRRLIRAASWNIIHILQVENYIYLLTVGK